MQLTRITPPSVEPVTLDEVKTLLRIDDTANDAFLTSLITASRVTCENFIHRSLLTQTWELRLDYYKSTMDLFYGPTQSISSVTSLLSDGSASVKDPTSYYLTKESTTGSVVLHKDYTWGADNLQPVGGVKIEYITGYGNTGADVPEPLRQGIIAYTAHMFSCSDTQVEIPFGVRALWSPYKIITL